jgi:VanZ family protein
LAAPAFWVCALAVLAIALGPVPAEEPLTGWDKSNHVLAFLVLTLLGYVAWPRHLQRLLWALAAYGVAIEVLQMFVPDHHAHLLDVVGDAVGIGCGWLVIRLTALRRLAEAQAV